MLCTKEIQDAIEELEGKKVRLERLIEAQLDAVISERKLELKKDDPVLLKLRAELKLTYETKIAERLDVLNDLLQETRVREAQPLSP